MAILFQVLKWSFYFMSLVMGIFLIRGNIIFGEELFLVLKNVLMPGYLIFCWVMIGYLIAIIWIGKQESDHNLQIRNKIYQKSFIIGILCGLLLSVSYIFI